MGSPDGSSSGIAVNRIDPGHVFRRFHGIDVGDVHHHGLII